jgi:tetratricopeptide (TPR) repeat protein
MALEKGSFARRKAQKLARDGEIAQAIEEMRLLVGEADSNPYDHVYLGDLLMREGRPEEALDAWMEAVHSYGRAGLQRNAIAVGKKVLRLDRGRVAVHRTLGELYCREGLLGEAMPHFLHWLDSVDGDAGFSDEFLATLERAGSTVGLQFEAALRVGDHYVRAGHHDRAARMLHELADKVQLAGSPEMASELRERARAAERTASEQKASESAAGVAMSAAIATDDLSQDPDVAGESSAERLAHLDTFAPQLPTTGGDGGVDGAAEGPFPEVVAAKPPSGSSVESWVEPPMEQPIEPRGEFPIERPAEPLTESPIEPQVEPLVGSVVEPPDEPPIQAPIELLAEPLDEPNTEPPVSSLPWGSVASPAEPLLASTVASPASSWAAPLAESPSKPPVFVVEHFPVAGDGLELPPTVRIDSAGAEGPEDNQGQITGRAEIDATAGDVSEDADERIWDLDAEEEALRIEPDAREGAVELAEPDEVDVAASSQISPGSAEPMPDASASTPILLPVSAWDEGPDSTEGSAEPDFDEISWPSGATVRSLVDRAEEAYSAGRWAEARGFYDRAAHEVSLEPMVLRRLVEIARKLEDPAAEVHYLEQLGDAWIEAGVMEEALESFLEVLRIDPDSCVARRRLSRFQEMGVPGAERIPEATRESVQGVLEAAGARMSVRDDPASAIQSDEWIDLGALIEEFREGIKNQIAGDDAAGHYDLAVSHHGMELFEEAVEELDLVLACPDLTVEMELHARELRGACLLALQRHREAVHEFRTALERPVPDPESRCSILYHLGVALESAEEWREAAEIFDRVQDELPGFLDAEARQSACELRANGIDPGARAA